MIFGLKCYFVVSFDDEHTPTCTIWYKCGERVLIYFSLHSCRLKTGGWFVIDNKDSSKTHNCLLKHKHKSLQGVKAQVFKVLLIKETHRTILQSSLVTFFIN